VIRDVDGMVTTPSDDVTVLAHFPVGVNAKKSPNSASFLSRLNFSLTLAKLYLYDAWVFLRHFCLRELNDFRIELFCVLHMFQEFFVARIGK